LKDTALTLSISINVKHININNKENENLIKNLSRRELEALTCSAFGLTSEMSGEQLGISKRTVEIHRSNLIKKLSARNLADAVRIAMNCGVKFQHAPGRLKGTSTFLLDFQE